MNITRIFLIFCLLASLSVTACRATPPTTGPNLNTDEGLFPTSDEIHVRPNSTFPEPSTTPGSDPGPVYGTTIRSHNGAFPAGSTVTVGVARPDGFAGNLPLVGPTNIADLSELAETFDATANGNGAVQFFLSTLPDTTPGTYTIFAELDLQRLEVMVIILP